MTPLQRKTLDFIESYIASNRYPPTYDEIKDAIGVKSKSSVYRLIQALELQGHIHRVSNMSRCIRLSMSSRVAVERINAARVLRDYRSNLITAETAMVRLMPLFQEMEIVG